MQDTHRLQQAALLHEDGDRSNNLLSSAHARMEMSETWAAVRMQKQDDILV
jgi:hypothetical protein